MTGRAKKNLTGWNEREGAEVTGQGVRGEGGGFWKRHAVLLEWRGRTLSSQALAEPLLAGRHRGGAKRDDSALCWEGKGCSVQRVTKEWESETALVKKKTKTGDCG